MQRRWRYLVNEVTEAVPHRAVESLHIGAPSVRTVLFHATDDALHTQIMMLCQLVHPCSASIPTPLTACVPYSAMLYTPNRSLIACRGMLWELIMLPTLAYHVEIHG